MTSEATVTAGPTSAETARSYRPLALAVVTALLIGLCLVLLFPFLPALAWGVALAVIAWPLQARIARHISNRHLATGLTTAIVVVVIVAPGLFVAYQLTREAGAAADRASEEQAAASVRDKLAGTKGLGGAVEWLDRVGVNVDHEVHKAVEGYTRDLASLIQGSLMGLVQFAVAMFILFHLLLDRETVMKRLRALMPMTRDESDQVVRSAADSVHANLHATLVTSAIDGIGGGVMFWLLGLPSPVTWGVVMFFLSFLPLLGTWLVWLPAVAILAIGDQWLYALILFGWGVASSIVVDNVVYVRIAGDRMRLHQVPALLAFLGGLAVFGISGMILGPGILAVTVAVLEVWHCRATETPLAPEVRSDSHLKTGVNGSQREILPTG